MIEFGIRKPITTLMIVLALIMFTAITTFQIPVELNPSTKSSLVSVITRLRGGVAASEVEKYVTRPLEEVFSEINGLKEMISSSKESESNIMMTFHHNIDTDFVIIDVREKIAMVKHKLPKETEKSVIAKFEQSDSPVLILSLGSDVKTVEQLREIAEEDIKEQILRVSGVANVEFGGGRERKFLIEMDNSKLLGYKLSILEVVQRINLANISISAGEIAQNNQNFVIRATGEYDSIEEIENTAIAITESGSIVRIGDIATVRDSFYEPTSFSRLNIQPVVSIYVQKESTANTIKVVKETLEVIEKLKKNLDEDIVVTTVKNDAEYISKAISSLVEALVVGGILLASILFLFMKNIRSIFIVATTMPLSLFMSVLLMHFTNQTFNIMTLSGLAMGMANVMDNSIVVLENISFHYHRKTFKDKAELVIKATGELWQPIFASTVTTIIVFLPLVFLDPEIRQMYVPFGLTITFALIASVIATMLFIPTQIYNWQNKFDLDFQRWYMKVRMYYGKILKFCFRKKTWIWLTIILLFVVSARILTTRDSEFMDPGDVNTFRIGVQFPPATRIELSNEVVKKMEQALLGYKDQVERVSSKVEKLHTFVEVKVYERPEEFKAEFRKRFGEFSPAFVYFQDSQDSAAKEIYVDFYGQNYDTLKQLAFSSSGRLQQVKGLTDVKIRMREDEPEVLVNVDYNRLAIFGLTTYYFSNTLHCQIRGLIATQYRTEGKQIETICRLYPGSIPNVDSIPFVGMVNPKKDVVYVGQVSEISKVKSNQEIWHKNKKRFIQISANRAKIGLTTAAQRINETLKGVAFPRDYSFKISGDYEKTVENRGSFILAVSLTVILIFFVLASIFESYLQPALIMFSLPLSIIGVAFVLWVFKKPISLGVWIGIMILFGCIVYSSIIIVDKINQRRHGRTNLLRVIFESCKERLRPELITLLMKTLGLLPMVLSRDESASMWRSLGLTVLFGTISGTILTMLIIPTAYYVLENPKKSICIFMRKIGLAFILDILKKIYNEKDFEQLKN
ncbi:efflux RND transporter permease subunit [Candidatus Ruminimicrobium bovinum]|uniref:efflux RND transporter permease subunit n=1 Tax=Candidatus Ruminimicrobium bovinum TaxID=3242779 RepID=UPI0039B96B1D